MNKEKRATIIAYIGIIAVVLVWGLAPSVKKALIGNSFSASIYSAITTFSAACVLLLLSLKELKNFNKDYLKVAIPTGFCVCVASLAQALAYNFNASPTNQAFLENLSCVIVPIILLIIIKKKPSSLSVVAIAFCLASSIVLTGVLENGLKFSTADILNALAGVFYGVNIAFTGIYAKKFIAPLYVMIQLFIQAIFSAMLAVVFNFISIGGKVVDPFVFTPNVVLVLVLVLMGVLSNAVCWTVRTSAMKHVSASVVAVIMPLSAVVTGFFAIMIGQDEPTMTLFIGALLGVVASILCSIGDLKESQNKSNIKE